VSRGPAFLDQLRDAVPGAVVGENLTALDPWIEIAPEKIAEACRWLASWSVSGGLRDRAGTVDRGRVSPVTATFGP
jgi:hypothetical protein